MRYDVVVAGGGLSGVTAAISAARGGAKVCLVEQTLTLGGLGTSGMMTVMISPKNFFGGTGREILDRLYGEDALGYGKGKDDYSFVPFQNEAMKRLLDSMVSEEANIDLLLYSKIIGAKCENGGVKSITVSAYEGIFEVEADVFIDATGDGALAVLCGEDYEYGDGNENIQAPTLPSYYVNVDYTKYYNFLKENNYDFIGTVKGLVEKAVDEGVLSDVDYHHPGENRITADIASMNVGHLYGMPLKSSKDFTAAMIAGRRLVREYYEFYKKYIPGFENSVCVATGSLLGVRETRRIKGKYMISYADKCEYRKFPDAVMRFEGGPSYDLHASSGSKDDYEKYFSKYTAENIRENDYATIPFSSFCAAKNNNLMVVGRCFSSDRFVNAQNRVMGYCAMMGDVAGAAAALSNKNKVRLCEISIYELQKKLQHMGILNV